MSAEAAYKKSAGIQTMTPGMDRKASQTTTRLIYICEIGRFCSRDIAAKAKQVRKSVRKTFYFVIFLENHCH